MTLIRPQHESWPANVANTRHTVDFRRSWVPSPEMRGPLALPSAEEGPANANASSYYYRDSYSCSCGSPSRPILSRSSWAYGGGEEKRVHAARGNKRSASQAQMQPQPHQNPPQFSHQHCSWHQHQHQHQYQQLAGDEPSFTRTRPMPLPRTQAREQERELEHTFEREQAYEHPRRGRRGSWLSFLHPKKLLFRKSRDRSAAANGASDAYGSYGPNGDNNEENWGHAQKREVAPAQWRAYGAWARPLIGPPWGMYVRNATPLDPPRELSPPQVDAMLASLREPDGTRHPEHWIPRVEHFSLPRRPDLWPTPRQTFDPLPEELTLNPFLEHRVVGRPPLHFDLRMRAEDILLGERPPPPTQPPDAGPSTSTTPGAGANLSAAERENRRLERERRRRVDFWCDGPNGSQPATYPGVPRLRITALAEDAQHAFPWPVTVLPHDEALPVLVKDVLNALVANFEERMSDEEVDALSEGRRLMLYQAYWRRVHLSVGGRTPPEDDGLRRVDYLGDAVYFRGLEPAPGGDGFMLFMGAPP